jgi:nucleotide-binding universal stress UspA family protein
MNTKRVLVAFDGTEQSFWALEHAAEAAVRADAAIGVVTVLPRIFDAPGQAARFLGELGLEAELHLPVSDDAASEISRIATEGAYDTVYVGRRDERDPSVIEDSVSRGVVSFARGNVIVAG